MEARRGSLAGEIVNIENFVRELPDPKAALLFYEQLTAENRRVKRVLSGDPGLLSDVLALASWSPLLATTLQQHPDYVQWLGRERANPRVQTREELGESLARFGLTNSQLDPQVLLSRFRRRELLRIYLRDIRNTSTVVETTEELSNLADAILEHALSLAQQEMDNRYGPPQKLDERGRVARASFCSVGLGKLGSLELNYASDIDLLFLYSDEGTTSGNGTRGEKSNREYFVKLAEVIIRLAGEPTGEGAAYRVDLRLRPHGRNGTLASSLEEAVRYYKESAQPWELQALIRARGAVGSQELFSRFAERVKPHVFRTDLSVGEALENVRLAKQKIDRHHASETGGYNVKLGSGGIREIEFIAQALQLAKGGRDEWLRVPHTLVSIGRLADRGLISSADRVQLFDAYRFLRKVEHRLQMVDGLQTHSVPDDTALRTLLACRMDFRGDEALSEFNSELKRHADGVRSVFERVLGEAASKPIATTREKREPVSSPRPVNLAAERALPTDSGTISALLSASVFVSKLPVVTLEELQKEIQCLATSALNAKRALTSLARIASSVEKSTTELALTSSGFARLVRFLGSSEPFGEMLAANPALIEVVGNEDLDHDPKNYRQILKRGLDHEESYRKELESLRQEWSRLIVGIAVKDAEGAINMRESNRQQSALASASIDAATRIARREIVRRFGELRTEPRLAVLGLGRLGGGGLDFGSDLDVVLVYDDTRESPLPGMELREAYARFTELFVAALSSMTRDGYLYRVDLRLRPDGKNGPSSIGAGTFLEYLKKRSAPWEWLAYVKLRAAGVDIAFGTGIEAEARRIVHAAARNTDAVSLREETRKVRERLQMEKTRPGTNAIDIKYGVGGMLDVYFATRYLQLRDDVPDQAGDRSTSTTLDRLLNAGSFTREEHGDMKSGYAMLRRLDHLQRLTLGRSTRLPDVEHPAFGDLARQMGSDPRVLFESVKERMRAIRGAYERILS